MIGRMHLTLYTDYSLRTLLYLGQAQDRLSTISEIADFYGISRNHLVKVTHNLSTLGFIQTVRGKSGGMRLARPAEQINIGAVVVATEPHMNIQECFDPATSGCPLTGNCRLEGVLYQARDAFMEVLNRQTLADILPKAPACSGRHCHDNALSAPKQSAG
jgi:Rrf2 family nitric oxide-sensitive transcriptional repressor